MGFKSVLAFTKRPSISEKEHKRNSVYRLLPLLFLMFYATGSVLRLASTSPAPSFIVSSSSSFVSEASKDFETLKTHVKLENTNHLRAEEPSTRITPAQCSEFINGKAQVNVSSSNKSFLCCDRRNHRTDICYMRGDIRTHSTNSSILIHNTQNSRINPEKIRPYTRKYEEEITKTIQEISISPVVPNKKCSVAHKVPALMFSTGGYTGNLYHGFSDGLVPLYISAERFRGEVVLVVVDYQSWWESKYAGVIRKLSNYEVVDFSRDRRVHCFSEMIVGLQFHGELTIHPHLMKNGKTIEDFQHLLDQGFNNNQTPNQKTLPPVLKPRTRTRTQRPCTNNKQPKLAIFIRTNNRSILNLKSLIKSCHTVGFHVQIINPKRNTPLHLIHKALSSSDAMLAVHGAAMTHFLFMRPSSVLMQIVPLGLHWPAERFYAEPARRLGLHYMAYNVSVEESSLSRVYDSQDVVLVNPSVITSKGWWEMKKIYLDQQNVRVNVKRFRRMVEQAFELVCR